VYIKLHLFLYTNFQFKQIRLRNNSIAWPASAGWFYVDQPVYAKPVGGSSRGMPRRGHGWCRVLVLRRRRWNHSPTTVC